MERLSGLDASFLTLETENAPMHIGGVSILTPTDPENPLDLDLLRRWVASRIHVSRSFRQRLAEVPLGLGKPYWVDEDTIDFEVHIERTQLPEPGGWDELTALAAWDHAEALDRSRPLWHFLLIEGLDAVDGVPPGSVAVLSKIHHAAIDGVSGAEILGALFAPTAEVPELPEAGSIPLPPSPDRENPAKAPGRLDLLRSAGANLKQVPGTAAEVVKDAAVGLAKSGAAWGLKRVQPPPMLFAAPRTSLNPTIGKRRTWDGALFDLARLKAIKKAAGTTLNDVVLAICAGALRRELIERDELPEKPLVAMVPVSVREEDESGAMGNRVSAMLVALATNEENPVQRLRGTHAEAQRAKLYHGAIGARTLTEAAELIPFGLGGVATRLYTRFHLAERHDPLFNVVITNVPGPQVPLYVAGARLMAHFGTAPIVDGMGLILPVFSYAGTLTVSAVSCPEALPDAARFARFLRESFDEIETAVSAQDDG